MKQLNVRISEQQYQELDNYARQTGIARQYLVSQALEMLLQKAKRKQARK